MIPALICTGVVAVIGHRRGGSWVPAATVTVVLAAIFLLSAVVNMPINLDQADWRPDQVPTDWLAIRDRWQVSHAVRTVAALAGFGLLLIAGAPPRRPARI
ncbi:DUF1772 domain-containing protein [Nocardia jinanensis]|uniref:DUF1772 domain-containing protein n=1 Tax=Nocardia jinanensis TaxID=382504 RepID=UPI001F1A5E25|nr:DUF1772 domain-containing protein [Nocardia jinanensis]